MILVIFVTLVMSARKGHRGHFYFLLLLEAWISESRSAFAEGKLQSADEGELTHGRGVIQREPWSRLYATTRWDVIGQAIP